MEFQDKDSQQIEQHSQLVEELFGSAKCGPTPSKTILPFTVRAVRTYDDLQKALTLRAACYEHHFTDKAGSYHEAEPEDLDPGSIIFLAESKETGEAVGCLRFMSNRHNILNIQKHVPLPDEISGQHIADIRRLSVLGGSRGKLVKLALFKAVFLHAMAMQVRYLVIAARAPLTRDYLGLYFRSVFQEDFAVDLLGKPHRVLYLEVVRAEREWHERGNRWYKTIFQDFHPDLELFSALSPSWVRGRAADVQSPLPSVGASRSTRPKAAEQLTA